MRRLAISLALILLVGTAGCLGAIELQPDSQPAGTTSPAPDPSLEPVDADLSVHYIDVGQADATFVRGPDGETMLIDTGHWNDDGEVVIDYLEARGVDRIDYLVSTHAHADHIGGSAALIDHYETELEGVGSVWDSGVPHTSQTYQHYLDAIEAHDVTLYETRAGDEIPMAGATVEVLNPPSDTGDDLDANTLALRIGYGDAGFLFTGDMTDATEPDLVERWGSDLQSTVYQVGHHGSSSSSTAGLLDTVDARVAIVSSANDSEYGHPHEEPLERLAERDVATYWTGSHGTIVAGTDGEAVTVRSVAEATTDPAELTDAAPADAPATATLAVRGTYGAGEAGATNSIEAPPASIPAEPAPSRGGAP